MRVLASVVMVVAAVLLVFPLQDNLLREAFKVEKKKSVENFTHRGRGVQKRANFPHVF